MQGNNGDIQDECLAYGGIFTYLLGSPDSPCRTLKGLRVFGFRGLGFRLLSPYVTSQFPLHFAMSSSFDSSLLSLDPRPFNP